MEKTKLPFNSLEAGSDEKEKRKEAIVNYIQEEIIAHNKSLGEDEEKEIKDYFQKLSPRDRADALYEKIMAYTIDKQTGITRKEGKGTNSDEKNEELPPDPYLISEIKVLFADKETKELFSDIYTQSRLEAKTFRLSELGNFWNNLNKEIKRKEEIYKQLERDIHLNKITNKTALSAARSRMGLLADNLLALKRRKQEVEQLKNFPHIVENTDIVANFQYEKLKEYKKQLDEGFVWLPSREKIHQQIVSAILNFRWPVLIGEAGSGKSQQANAAALELTGYPPTEIECERTTGEKQLIMDKEIDPQTGGSYDRYGPLMEAFTGYENSIQTEPKVKTGRIARFDESTRLGERAYSIIKKARQKKTGDDFYGRPVLAGAGAIWTTNPIGPRYPDRSMPDPAMRRELAEIQVDYPEMSKDNPELYEFALAALFDDNNYIQVAKEELAPAYETKQIPEDQREILPDGSVVVAKQELVENMADKRHGALWRFCAAIKSLQDSFVYGNAQVERYPDNLLRFQEDADGNIEIVTEGSGQPLTLSTSTVTLGELSSWLKGFNERRQKEAEEFRVETFTEWLNFKINTYINQADKSDKEKIKAIFRHFGFLDKSVIVDISQAKPLTPKEIGYLSPRVPRPVIIEKPTVIKDEKEVQVEQPKEVKEYETKEVLLENGDRVLIKTREFTIEQGLFDIQAKTLVPLVVVQGTNLRINNKEFSYSGVVEDENSPYNGQPVVQLAGEELYQIINSEDLDKGIFFYDSEELIADIDVMKDDIEEFCEMEKCEVEAGTEKK